MAKTHVWRVKKEYFRQLKNGERSLEIRVGYPQAKRVEVGDIITFENYGPNEFLVRRIGVYENFKEMLETEGATRALPGMTFGGALRLLQEIYPPDREVLGVYTFELEFQTIDIPPTREFYKASDLLKAGENKRFAKLVTDSYLLTDWISKDYPNHCGLFFGKYVPGIFCGEREIIACYIGRKIAALTILKKSEDENKISTLYVKPGYQKQGIATELLEQSFKWLGTTKPVATIADYRLEQFQGIIQKYGWVETKVLEEGYYNDHSREHVFNQ